MFQSSKLHPKRNAIAEHFCCGNTLIPISVNFGAGEAHTKMRSVQQI